MPTPALRLAALVALVAAPLAGCATSAPPAASAAPAQASAADGSDLEALYWQRQRDARADFTPADVAFMTGMIGHHAQALVMSRLAPTHGAGPAVRRLAARIINAQTDEIESMQRWLRVRGRPVPTATVDGLTLVMGIEGTGGAEEMDHRTMSHSDMVHDETPSDEAAGGGHGGMDHGAAGHGAMAGMDHSAMPGMLSQTQLQELDAARGPAFDRLFLRYMIQHHGGAITMVDDLLATDGAAQDVESFKLASDIHADQATEIARMGLMLDERTDG